ncbi:hypothetical protein TWF481_005448 [Arthrobotrys musiformis]|uniref:Uncharacterized protein n=1 Tax=Arthrobotrys musiformis TaxID=47236 RepID=A0AAV9WFG5_9PEZI
MSAQDDGSGYDDKELEDVELEVSAVEKSKGQKMKEVVRLWKRMLDVFREDGHWPGSSSTEQQQQCLDAVDLIECKRGGRR